MYLDADEERDLHTLIEQQKATIERLQAALETISRGDFEIESKAIASNALAGLAALTE